MLTAKIGHMTGSFREKSFTTSYHGMRKGNTIRFRSQAGNEVFGYVMGFQTDVVMTAVGKGPRDKKAAIWLVPVSSVLEVFQ